MIKKSIAAALVMLGVYHLLLPHLSHKFYEILGQQRNNYLRAQRYVYDVPNETKVIVGSSMAATLNDKVLGPAYCKLTFAGGNIFTGLGIVQASGKVPPIVLIETNLLGREPDQEILHDLFSPPFYQLRRHSGIFREEGRPANFLGGAAEAVVRKTCQWTTRIFYPQEAPDSSVASDTVTPELHEKLLRIEQKGWDYEPAPEMLRKQTDKLGAYVDALQRQGSVCILFEMPIDSSLWNLRSSKLWREAMNGRFPPDRYHWLNFDQSHNYETRDGVHLVQSEADRVTQKVVDYVNQVSTGQATPGKPAAEPLDRKSVRLLLRRGS